MLLNVIRGTPLPAYSLASHKGGNRLSDYKSAGIPSTFPTDLKGFNLNIKKTNYTTNRPNSINRVDLEQELSIRTSHLVFVSQVIVHNFIKTSIN